MPATRVLSTLMLTIACSSAAQAQSPEQRTELRLYQDSLAGMPTAALGQEVNHWRTHADSAPTPMALLRIGVVSLTLAEREHESRFDQARRTFQQAAALAPDWPWPHYGVGLARAAKGRWQADEPLNLGKRVGYGELEGALEAQFEALAVDAGFVPALLEIAGLVAVLQDSGRTARALAAFQTAAATEAFDSPDFQLARARLERAAGDPDSALAALVLYRKAGGVAGMADLETARTSLGAGRSEGSGPYYEGARSEDSGTVAGYRADLAYIADPTELTTYDRARGEEREGFLRGFWGKRDAWDLRDPGTRLVDHYMRLDYARRHFALRVNRRFYRWVDMYRSGSTELDDRGVVYVRQGPPDMRIAVPVFGFFPNETWRYRRADGDLLLHFSGGGGQSADGYYQTGGDPGDLHLIPSLLNAGSPGPGDSVLLFTSRSPVTDLYGKYMTWGKEGRRRVIEQERKIVAVSVAVATGTDADELQFEKELGAVVDLLALGQDSGRTRLNVILGIPVLVGDTSKPDQLIPIRTRLGVFDTSHAPVAHLDSLLILHLVGRAQAGGWLFARVTLTSPPGDWTYRLAVQRGNDRGVVFPRTPIHVGRFDGSRVAISDLAVGHVPGGWPWLQPSGDTAYVSPFHSYRRGQHLSLYYEVYGLKRGGYATAISVYDRDGIRVGRRRLSLSFHATAAAPVSRVQQTIDLGGLAPGRYWLEVRVQDAVQRKAIIVLPDGEDR